MNESGGFMKVKVCLGGCKVERCMVLPENITLQDFHDAIQAAFGWDHSHLWSFKAKGGDTYQIRSEDDHYSLLPFRKSPKDASRYTLCDLLPKHGSKATYTYDFGDNWIHFITRMSSPKESSTMCVKSAGPDCEEDFGGCWRWSAYLYVIENGREKVLAQDPDFPKDVLESYDGENWTPEKTALFLKGPSTEEVTKRMREQIGKSVDWSRMCF